MARQEHDTVLELKQQLITVKYPFSEAAASPVNPGADAHRLPHPSAFECGQRHLQLRSWSHLFRSRVVARRRGKREQHSLG